ncbi:hypothetical protein Tco_0233038 [Tanacetum coccineum]
MTTEISQSSGPIHLVADEIVYKEWKDRMEMATTTASSLEAEQDSALVDKKKVIITETSIRSDLKLDDAKGIDCLPTASIFPKLERMGYEHLTQKLTFYKAYFSSQWKFLIHTILQCLSAKTTAWNEFSSTMASAIICLTTNQTFNFSKYIFDNMVKHLEGGIKFLIYPWFVQVFLDKQVEGMTRHKEVYVTPSHTKKVFANMKRPGKGFSGRVTPLFPTMMIQALEDMGEDLAAHSDSTPIISQPSSSKPQKKKSRRKQRKYSGPTEPVTNEAHVSTPSYDPYQSGEDNMQLFKLMNLCTSLQEKVLDLEKAKTAQAKEIASLKKKSQAIRKEKEVKNSKEDASKHERKTEDLDADAEVTLVNKTQEMNDDNLMFDIGVLEEQEIEFENVVEEHVIKTIKPKPVTTIVTTVTSVRPRAKGIIFHDQEEQVPTSTKTFSSSQSQLPQVKYKSKGKMVKPKNPLKKKDQIALDEEMARNLEVQMEAELIVEERLARQKEEETNIVLIESWDNTQAMIEADFELAQRLQVEEQGEITIKERSRLFVELINRRKKHFAKLRAEEIKRKPPTKAQKRNQMSTYLKNIAGFKHKVVKGSETRTEESSKRAGDKLESDKSKNHKIDEHVEAEKDDDLEEEEMKKHMEIVQDEEEIAIDAIPLATKPPMIVEYKIGIDKEDLETLWKLVKDKHGINKPVDEYERVLWGDLKLMFKPDIKSDVWRNLQSYNYWKEYADRDEIKD